MLAFESKGVENIFLDSPELRNYIGAAHLVAGIFLRDVALWLCMLIEGISWEAGFAVDSLAAITFHWVDRNSIADDADKGIHNTFKISTFNIKSVFRNVDHILCSERKIIRLKNCRT